MALGRCRSETSGRLARVLIGPEPGSADEGVNLCSMWSRLGLDEDVDGVLVVVRSTIGGARSGPDGQDAGVLLGPKSNRLLKPVGVGVVGPARDETLEIIGESDVIVATPEASFADTSGDRGETARFAPALKSLLVQSELMRIALGGEAMAMSSSRAAQLDFVDAVVSEGDLESELTRRVAQLLPRRGNSRPE